MTYQRLLRRNGLTGGRNSGELEAIAADLAALERDTMNDVVVYAAACGLTACLPELSPKPIPIFSCPAAGSFR